MTRRERLERKVERRREWSEKAAARSSSAFERAQGMASAIPFGQPILVGHHSEKRDRRYRAKICATFDTAAAEHQKAQHHDRRADGLAHQLETSIYSDDPDATLALRQKMRELEQSCEQSKAMNTAYKRGGIEAIEKQFGHDLACAARDTMALGWSWIKVPFSNESARREIRRCKLRIAEIEKRAARTAAAQDAGGVKLTCSETWATVTFAEKPAREVLAALRAAGYRWGAGSWSGRRECLPECVVRLVETEGTNHAAE